MFWFLLWVLFALAVLLYMGWSTNIVLAQRKAWREFADKYKLPVTLGKGMIAPISITGMVGGRRINIYAETEAYDDRRIAHTFTHIEVFLNNPPPALCILSKKPLPEFMQDWSLPQVLTMQSPDWPKPAVAMTDDPIALANWLSGRTLTAFKAFMDAGGRGDEPMFVYDSVNAFLLWRTEDPLRDPRALNAMAQKMFAWAKDMDVQPPVSSNAKPMPASDSTPSATSA